MKQSDLQAEAWRRCRAKVLSRGKTMFVFDCVDCPTIFRGTGNMARERGWKKVWRRVGRTGVRQQYDQCPACREASRGAA